MMPVSDVAGEQRERDVGKRLREAHEAERERIARDVVDLPGDDDGLNLRGDGHRQQRDDEPAVVLYAECGVGVMGHVMRNLASYSRRASWRTSSASTRRFS